jgi:hypothetical protein
MKTKRQRKYLFALLIIVGVSTLLVTSIALAAILPIDDLNGGQQNLSAFDTSPVVFEAVSYGLGGERDVEVWWDSGFGDVSVGIDRGLPPGSNYLAFSLDSDTTGHAFVIWDGTDGVAALDPDGLCSNPGCSGGTGVDLTDVSTNDALHFKVLSSDHQIDVNINVFSGNEANYKYFPLQLPADIAFGRQVDIIMPFADFQDGGSGADFNNVGAIRMLIDGRIATAAEVTLDSFQADNYRDYGDAPAGYGTPNHAPLGLRLGENVDAEVGALSGSLANGDDTNLSDDEDGVVRTPAKNWTPGSAPTNGGSVDVVMNGCLSTPCYVNGWVDWDNDGNFTTAGDQVLVNRTVSVNGITQSLGFDIPLSATVANGTFYARFRICSSTGACNSPTSTNVLNGEVEDYQWSFGPTAITLESFGARVANQASLMVFIVGLLVIAGGALLLNRWRQRRI